MEEEGEEIEGDTGRERQEVRGGMEEKERKRKRVRERDGKCKSREKPCFALPLGSAVDLTVPDTCGELSSYYR